MLTFDRILTGRKWEKDGAVVENVEIEKVEKEDVLNGTGLKRDSLNICYCQLQPYISRAANGCFQKSTKST